MQTDSGDIGMLLAAFSSDDEQRLSIILMTGVFCTEQPEPNPDEQATM